MSLLSLSQSATAIAANITSSFLANGGTPPYTYSIRQNGKFAVGGAGGTINSSTGVYTAPNAVNGNPQMQYDIIVATDNAGNQALGQILVGDPLLLVRDIIQNQLGLDDDHIYLWDQKLFQPKDFGLYVAIGVQSLKPFSNISELDGSGSGTLNAQQWSSWRAVLSLDIISRGPAARMQKEQVLMALASPYSIQQQERNSFNVGKLPVGSQFVNLSNPDGAAIPYRFNISISLQYFAALTSSFGFYDTFTRQINTNP